MDEYIEKGGRQLCMTDAGFLVEPRQPHPPVPGLPQGGKQKRHITGSKQAIEIERSPFCRKQTLPLAITASYICT